MLADAVKGGRRPSQQITWTRADGIAEDLSGATLSGILTHQRTGETRTITGDLIVTDGASGVFTWAYSAADVAESGRFNVQFTAVFAADPTPARTAITSWRVLETLTPPEEA